MGKRFNSPAYHAIHHARCTRNHGLLTPWLDRVFGTGWSDRLSTLPNPFVTAHAA